MTRGNDGFALHVHVPADEWAYAQRRLTYLEAVLVRLLRGEDRVREWYDAAELAAMRLPGLPGTKAGVTRLAKAESWRRRERKALGGTRYQYHCTALPKRAFDALIARVLDLPDPGAEPLPKAPDLPAPPPPPPSAVNAEPAWVLPFMRLLKGGAQGDVAAAWRELPKHLPAGVTLPSREEAAEAIIRLGLVSGS